MGWKADVYFRDGKFDLPQNIHGMSSMSIDQKKKYILAKLHNHALRSYGLTTPGRQPGRTPLHSFLEGGSSFPRWSNTSNSAPRRNKLPVTSTCTRVVFESSSTTSTACSTVGSMRAGVLLQALSAHASASAFWTERLATAPGLVRQGMNSMGVGGG